MTWWWTVLWWWASNKWRWLAGGWLENRSRPSPSESLRCGTLCVEPTLWSPATAATVENKKFANRGADQTARNSKGNRSRSQSGSFKEGIWTPHICWCNFLGSVIWINVGRNKVWRDKVGRGLSVKTSFVGNFWQKKWKVCTNHNTKETRSLSRPLTYGVCNAIRIPTNIFSGPNFDFKNCFKF